MDSIKLSPVGVVHSPVIEGRDEAWGGVVSELRFDEQYAAGLQGLEQFSHVVVIFWMHQSTFEAETDLVRHPRGLTELPKVGIFAQRAKYRPNPIGITAVKLLGREGAVLKVQGLDAINGSPILDVKPYFASFDAVANPVAPEWVAKLMQGYF